MIPYFKPPQISTEKVLPYIEEILTTRIYTKGIHRYELGDSLARYLNIKYAITCSSGTMALYIGLKVLKDLFDYETVIMPSFNWTSDKISAEMAGYEIKYADITSDTWHLAKNIEHDDKTVVLGLDTFGNIDSSNRYDIIDATHSLGAKNTTNRSLITCFSMAATKTVTSGGEGGFIATNDDEIAQKAIELRDICSRLPEISCVIAQEYLTQLNDNIKAKIWIANYYRTQLPYEFQKIEHDSTCSKVCFLCDNSAEVIKKCAEKGIECRKYYKPLVKGLKNSDEIYSRIVCIPAWVGVNANQVVEAIL